MSSSLGFRAYASGLDAYAGTMNLSVGRSGDRSRPVRTESAGVLRLMKPLHLDDSGQVAYFVVNPGGAYFSEACRMDVEVLPGASLLLSSQGATRIYRTPRGPACAWPGTSTPCPWAGPGGACRRWPARSGTAGSTAGARAT